MSKLITLTEASNMTGISRQSLTNWGQEGIIKIKKIKKNGTGWYVDKESLKEIADVCFDIEQARQRLQQELEETKKAEAEAREVLKDIRRQIKLTRRFANMVIATDFDRTFIKAMFDIGKINTRESQVMEMVVRGDDIDSIANQFYLTRARIMQIFFKACRKCGNVKDIVSRFYLADEKEKKNAQLTEEMKILARENENLRMKLEIQEREDQLKTEEEAKQWLAENNQLFKLFSTKLVDCCFSVRALNCLKSADIKTIGDLVQYDGADLLKFRNFGRKTLTELSDFLEDHKLSWNTDVETFYRKSIEARLKTEKTNN